MFAEIGLIKMEDKAIPSKQQFISISSLKQMGFSYYKINQMVRNGMISKINNKFYENKNYVGEQSDFYYAYAYVPNGVVCLSSAASYYNLVSSRLDKIDVAIRRKDKSPALPIWPEIKLHYYSDKRFENGLLTINEGENTFKIYDVEKTVVDLVSFKEKIGIEEVKEVLTNYLKREGRDLNKLIRYAKLLNCEKTLSTYLEVLL